MTLLDYSPSATSSRGLVPDAPTSANRAGRSASRTSTYVTAPGAVPVKIGSYRRGVRAPRTTAAAPPAELTYGDFFAAPGA